jgi:alkylation response protein AidB-like acyl-CoA dehydrogenase
VGNRNGKILAAARGMIPELQERAEEIEKLRQLPDSIVRNMVDAGMIQMGIPAEFGGLESDLVEIMRVIEAISYGDGSAGWCLMNYQTTAFLAGYLSTEWGKAIFQNAERAVPTGVLLPQGQGRRVEGGVIASGRWTFGSGCPNSNWFFGNTTILPGENAPQNSRPETLFLIFSREQFRSDDNWHVTGLCGTGSHDVIVEDAFVPEGR